MLNLQRKMWDNKKSRVTRALNGDYGNAVILITFHEAELMRLCWESCRELGNILQGILLVCFLSRNHQRSLVLLLINMIIYQKLNKFP